MADITVDYIDHMGSDLTVVNAARVSFDKESRYVETVLDDGWVEYSLADKDAKLIKYLAEHDHLSPFGHCFASFRVTAPVFVSRQLVKHKFLRINEVSRRYVDTPPEFYQPKEWRGKPVNKKQGSDGVVNLDTYIMWDNPVVGPWMVGEETEEWPNRALKLYNKLLEAGVAPEMARMVLPQNMMTSWYWSGSLDAFANMASLRLKPDAQYETRIVAEKISEIMAALFPVSWKALVK